MKYANYHGYSDITPYEIVRKVSETTLEIRRMHYERDESVKMEFHVGGFSANCSNQLDQKWFITSDTEHGIERIRFSKAKQQWQSAHGERFILSDKPVRFYDYNF